MEFESIFSSFKRLPPPSRRWILWRAGNWLRGRGCVFDSSSLPPSQVSNHLITPLLSIIGELCRRQSELIKIIGKKDREIQDYKDQGTTVSRRRPSSFLWLVSEPDPRIERVSEPDPRIERVSEPDPRIESLGTGPSYRESLRVRHIERVWYLYNGKL